MLKSFISFLFMDWVIISKMKKHYKNYMIYVFVTQYKKSLFYAFLFNLKNIQVHSICVLKYNKEQIFTTTLNKPIHLTFSLTQCSFTPGL